jgi:antitoxin CptB
LVSSQQKAKLKWQCRRGMLELDLMLNKFFLSHLDQLNEIQLHAFEQLLTYSDPEIYCWLIGQETPFDQEILDIVALIQSQHPN